MFKNLSTVSQGSVGLSGAVFYYQSVGYNVLLPLVDNNEYDLVIEKDDKFLTVQVKTTSYYRYTSYVVQLKSVRSNRTKNIIKPIQRVDLLFVLCENGNMYSIPFDFLIRKGTDKPKSSVALNTCNEFLVMKTNHV